MQKLAQCKVGLRVPHFFLVSTFNISLYMRRQMLTIYDAIIFSIAAKNNSSANLVAEGR